MHTYTCGGVEPALAGEPERGADSFCHSTEALVWNGGESGACRGYFLMHAPPPPPPPQRTCTHCLMLMSGQPCWHMHAHHAPDRCLPPQHAYRHEASLRAMTSEMHAGCQPAVTCICRRPHALCSRTQPVSWPAPMPLQVQDGCAAACSDAPHHAAAVGCGCPAVALPARQ